MLVCNQATEQPMIPIILLSVRRQKASRYSHKTHKAHNTQKSKNREVVVRCSQYKLEHQQASMKV